MDNTERLIREQVKISTEVMIEKNKQRADCWRPVGLMGTYIEIKSIYYRLHQLIWKQQCFPLDGDVDKWYNQVSDALGDLRNFTTLADICLIEQNLFGDDNELL